MRGNVYCYHYTICAKPGQCAIMCIVTITLPVQSQVNERSCVLLPLHHLYKAKTMIGHVYCYHYAICSKPGQCAIMCIVTITLPVQIQDNERSFVLLPLHYLYKASTMSGHVYCYHYTTCKKPGKWAVICIVTITLPVQTQENERSCVVLPLHYLYKAR
jgi:predicted Co/Zn/Cd cation transporter (cation efflux family)